MEYGSQNGTSAENLADDVKFSAQDAEDALRSTGAQMNEQYQDTKAKLREKVSRAKNGFSEMEQKVGARTREVAGSADHFVKEHPWQSVGIGAVAGLVAGLLMTRR